MQFIAHVQNAVEVRPTFRADTGAPASYILTSLCTARPTRQLERNITMAEDMHINSQRAKQLTENVAGITSRINAANKSGQKVTAAISYTLVVVK